MLNVARAEKTQKVFQRKRYLFKKQQVAVIFVSITTGFTGLIRQKIICNGTVWTGYAAESEDSPKNPHAQPG
ncbi:MAG: hypothetical protein D3922_00550 [Candidatus Electrothrix sp. AR1]|nr:hypothetical protein [Candidatus Electrothrix sp. AR1]